VKFHDLTHEIEATACAAFVGHVVGAEARLEDFHGIFEFQRLAGGSDPHADTGLSRGKVILKNFPTVGNEFASSPVRKCSGFGIFERIGEKIVKDLGDEPSVHDQPDDLVGCTSEREVDFNTSFFESLLESLNQRGHHSLGEIDFPFVQYIAAFFEMTPTE